MISDKDVTVSSISSPPFLRSMISSDIQNLDFLYETYKWIPSSERIRPNPELLDIKRMKIQEISNSWLTFKDYILHHIFQKPYFQTHHKFYINDDNVKDCKLFLPNEFPYTLQQGNHWIMWYGQETQDQLSIEQITQDIDDEIQKLLSVNSNHTPPLNESLITATTSISSSTSDTTSINPTYTTQSAVQEQQHSTHMDYDFAWYINPKMSVPEFFHVQVFWIDYSRPHMSF